MAFDILLKNGRIIDGKGNPWFRGDVAVADGRIHAVRPRIQGEAREELDASRYVVCPGFIDAHTHSEGDYTTGDRGCTQAPLFLPVNLLSSSSQPIPSQR